MRARWDVSFGKEREVNKREDGAVRDKRNNNTRDDRSVRNERNKKPVMRSGLGTKEKMNQR